MEELIVERAPVEKPRSGLSAYVLKNHKLLLHTKLKAKFTQKVYCITCRECNYTYVQIQIKEPRIKAIYENVISYVLL